MTPQSLTYKTKTTSLLPHLAATCIVVSKNLWTSFWQRQQFETHYGQIALLKSRLSNFVDHVVTFLQKGWCYSNWTSWICWIGLVCGQTAFAIENLKNNHWTGECGLLGQLPPHFLQFGTFSKSWLPSLMNDIQLVEESQCHNFSFGHVPGTFSGQTPTDIRHMGWGWLRSLHHLHTCHFIYTTLAPKKSL